MKILYVYDSMPKGYQTFLTLSLEGLREKSNVSTLAYEKNGNADYNINTYGFLDLYQRLLFKLKLSKYKSRDIYIMSKYDIVHLQHSYLFRKILPFNNIDEDLRPKIIVSLKGADTYMKPWLSIEWEHFYRNQSNTLVTNFITMSHHLKCYLQKWGVVEDKIYVSPISYGKRFIIEPKYPNKDVLKLVSAYRMVWEKNIDKCLRFALELKIKEVKFEYDIYGDGNDMGQLYYLIDRYDLHGYVFVKGKVDNGVLKNKLTDYDFYIQLSLSESFGASVIEAEAYGVPSIISDVDGLPETIIKNVTGLIELNSDLKALAHDCLSLWRDEKRYYQFSKNAIKFVNDNYSLENELERLNTLYKKVTNN